MVKRGKGLYQREGKNEQKTSQNFWGCSRASGTHSLLKQHEGLGVFASARSSSFSGKGLDTQRAEGPLRGHAFTDGMAEGEMKTLLG